MHKGSLKLSLSQLITTEIAPKRHFFLIVTHKDIKFTAI